MVAMAHVGLKDTGVSRNFTDVGFLLRILMFVYNIGQERIFTHSKLLCERDYLVIQPHQ